jgi:hypothetical protein
LGYDVHRERRAALLHRRTLAGLLIAADRC